MRPQIMNILTIVLSLFSSTAMLAQHISSDSGPPPPGNGFPPELPIDQGVVLLLLFGFLMGVYVVLKTIKENNAAR